MITGLGTRFYQSSKVKNAVKVNLNSLREVVDYVSLLGLVGMIGFLNGVTKAPITSFVLVLEMTDRHTTVFPMMLAAIFSTFSSFLISHNSYYELTSQRITDKGF